VFLSPPCQKSCVRKKGHVSMAAANLWSTLRLRGVMGVGARAGLKTYIQKLYNYKKWGRGIDDSCSVLQLFVLQG